MPRGLKFVLGLALLGPVILAAGCSRDRPDPGNAAGAVVDIQTPGAIADLPEWMTTPLFDLRTNDSFTIAEFRNQVVVVELMTGECTPCEEQLEELQRALRSLGEGVIPISINISPGFEPEQVVQEANRLDRDWRLASAGPDFALALNNAYGGDVLEPTNSPILLIGPDGQVIVTRPGVVSANRLEEAIEDLRR